MDINFMYKNNHTLQ